MARLVDQEGCRSTKLSDGWTCSTTEARDAGTSLPSTDDWIPAAVPGSVALAWRRARPDWQPADLHALDHWYRLDMHLPPGAWLEFAGLATLAEVWIDGCLVAKSGTMFRPLVVPIPPGGGERLEICFRALRPVLRRKRSGPRARWRSNLVDEEALRHHRTTLVGHMPGWSGATPVIGPVRPVILHQPLDGAPVVRRAELRTEMTEDGTGLVSLRLEGLGLSGRTGSVTAGGQTATLDPVGDALCAVLRLSRPPLWWPHTHGEPATLALAAEIDGAGLDLGCIGFRTIARRDPALGFGLNLNDTPVFCRGAIWTGLDTTGTPADLPPLRSALGHARRAGLNMLRISGMTTYETPEFFDLCDQLGIMVWHDLMFARFDYPQDPDFINEACTEARAFLSMVRAHPCLTVLCGGVEVAQTAAMSGCAPAAWRMPLFEDDLAQVAAEACPDVPFVPQSPWAEAETLPFAAAASISHYFGIGAYQRPLGDLSAAGVRFASECLAFANPPEPATRRASRHADDAPPRDLHAGWDFADVRDHYTRALFGDAPALAKRQDRATSDSLARAGVALIMQHSLATWRSDGVCAGALVLMLHDVLPGAGWGVIAHDGRPKSALYALHHVCQPIQVLLRDLGHNGVVTVLLNETVTARRVRVSLRGLRPDGTVEQLGETVVELEARASRSIPATTLMGRWRDLANAWQFGPPGFVVLGATLDDTETGVRLSDAVTFPVGPALPCGQPDLSANVEVGPDGWSITVSSRGFAQFVQIDDDACIPADSYFHLWPGETRVVALHPSRHDSFPSGTVSALNAWTPAHYRMVA